jgi:hypothetical protein
VKRIFFFNLLLQARFNPVNEFVFLQLDLLGCRVVFLPGVVSFLSRLRIFFCSSIFSGRFGQAGPFFSTRQGDHHIP